jgi:hypothetical protein
MTLDDMPEINTWIHARSGAGGAFLSELYDQNWTPEGTWNYGNQTIAKTNEYAGSPNSFIIEDIDRHIKYDHFPDWSEKTILLGKWHNPIKILTRIICPTFYYIDSCEGIQKYLNELCFIKKCCGNDAMTMCQSGWLETMKEDAFRKRGWENQTTMTAYQRFRDMVYEISPLLSPNSDILYSYFLKYNTPYKEKIDKKHFLGYLRGEFYSYRFNKRWGDRMNNGVWLIEDNHSALAAETDVHIISYIRLMRGESTDTPFDKYPDEIKEYHERNKELRIQFYNEVLGGTNYLRDPDNY